MVQSWCRVVVGHTNLSMVIGSSCCSLCLSLCMCVCVCVCSNATVLQPHLVVLPGADVSLPATAAVLDATLTPAGGTGSDTPSPEVWTCSCRLHKRDAYGHATSYSMRFSAVWCYGTTNIPVHIAMYNQA